MKKFYSVLAMATVALAGSAATIDLQKTVTTQPRQSEKFSELKSVKERISLQKAPELKAAPIEGSWTSLGTGTYSEDLFASTFSVFLPGTKWDVEIEQNNENKGWYRFVAYGEESPLAELMGLPDVEYLYVNATDPNKVYVTDFNPYGSLDPDGGFTFAQICTESDIAAGFLENPDNGLTPLYGTLSNGVISFPKRSFLYVEGQSASFANMEGQLKVALPGTEMPSDWELLGTAEFVECIIAPATFREGEQQEATVTFVTVERNKANKNLIRVLEPWVTYGGTWDLKIDLTEPDFVSVPFQATTLSFGDPDKGGDGLCYIVGLRDLYKSTEDFLTDPKHPDNEKYAISYKNNVVSIPADAVLLHFPQVDQENFYFAGAQLVSTLEVPTAGIDNVIVDDINAPVEYFNLQGVKVENPENGLYIRRQGSQAVKTLVK